MTKKEDLLGYCGLYCEDCAGFSGQIAEAAIDLKNNIDKYKLHITAKELFEGKLKDFDKFYEMLQFITELKCPQICRERGTPEGGCKVKVCCREKGYFACYECKEFDECQKLKSLEDLHGDACIENLKSINDLGLSSWIEKGKRLWFGTNIDD